MLKNKILHYSMKSYKKLKSKKKIVDKRATITELHDKKMKEFENYYKTLPQKEKELESLRKKIKGIDTTDYKNIIPLKDLQKKEEELILQIQEMKDQTDMTEYLITFAKIIKNDDTSLDKEEIVEDNTGINKYIIVKEGNKKGNLLEKYINACNGNYELQQHKKKNMFICKNCKNQCVFNLKECYITCKNCGECIEWQDPDIPQWSDEVDVSKAYRYKRLGYFIEHLYRVQAKECTVIPDNVISKLLLELKKRRITEPEKITPKLIKGFLKNLDLTNYYDNVNSIIRTLSGKEAPVFPEELEDKLVVMFMRTQQPFEKYKHLIPDRNNYLSYPYVIRQLLLIISRNEENEELLKFVKMFPLLKSRMKLWYQEKVWEKICEECEWTFYPSI